MAAATEDEERLKIFIDAMNELLPDDVRDEASLTLQDFTFASVAERFVHMPVFTDDCLQVRRHALNLEFGVPFSELTRETLGHDQLPFLGAFIRHTSEVYAARRDYPENAREEGIAGLSRRWVK